MATKRKRRRPPDWLDFAVVLFIILIIAGIYWIIPSVFPGLGVKKMAIEGSTKTDKGEEIIAAKIVLYDEKGNIIGTKQSDEEGEFKFEDVEAGLYSLQAEKDGYKGEEIIKVEDRDIRGLILALVPPVERVVTTNFGELSISSTPAEAVVYLDGEKEARGITPLTIGDLEQGEYKIKLVLEGYQAWEGLAQVRAGEATPLKAELSAIPVVKPKTAILAVTSEPTGALVRVDRFLIGRTPVQRIINRVGERELILNKDGYESWRKKVEFLAGGKVAEFVKLEEVSEKGAEEVYRVQTGSFTYEDNAKRQAARFERRGYKAEIYKSGKYYVVIVTLTNREEAEALKKEVGGVNISRSSVKSSLPYRVQIGAFKVKDNAVGRRNELIAMGYKAAIEQRKENLLYRVVIRTLSREEAVKLSDEIREGGFATFTSLNR